jgi:nitric oxide reductase NorQ protein
MLARQPIGRDCHRPCCIDPADASVASPILSGMTRPAAEHGMQRELAAEDYRVEREPFYRPVGDEVDIFRAAFSCRLPVLLKGPTGCGKTRFVEYMAYHLGDPTTPSAPRPETLLHNGHAHGLPLITVSCHEDLTASDLVGRYLLHGDETVWIDGPLTRAVRNGALCYLDEIVEARKDTTVLIHALTDHRRLLPLEKRGEILAAHDNFLLVISYNPGYQSVIKDLKHSTRQRFVAIEFDYPPRQLEAEIIAHESGVEPAMALELARIGEKVRNLRDHGLEEGVSTRLLIYAGQLITQGISAHRACQLAVTKAMTDDLEAQRAVDEIIATILP